MSERAHGTRTKFVHDHCTCIRCRAANADYAASLNRRHLYGQAVLVDPEPARQHLEQLRASGLGLRRIAALSGVSRSALAAIATGHRPDRAADRIRPETAAALLAVPTAAPLADGVAVDGTGIRRRLRALVACGWPQQRLAAQIGWTAGNFTKLITEDGAQVAPRTAAAVTALYERLWNTPPATDTPQQLAGVNRARARAARAGWVLPAAWDDDEIDNPDAVPASGNADARRKGLDLDEVAFLTGQGLGTHEIAHRFGVTVGAIERAQYRAKGTAA